MGKARSKQVPARRRGGRWALVALLLIGIGVAAGWWLAAPPASPGGAPRLVVDRTDVDLGYRRFDVAARVVFTLTNAGDAPLVLNGVPRVIVKAGC